MQTIHLCLSGLSIPGPHHESKAKKVLIMIKLDLKQEKVRGILTTLGWIKPLFRLVILYVFDKHFNPLSQSHSRSEKVFLYVRSSEGRAD